MMMMTGRCAAGCVSSACCGLLRPMPGMKPSETPSSASPTSRGTPLEKSTQSDNATKAVLEVTKRVNRQR
ncbi:hypothetical protein TcBrA4_0023680 [Trypanosoma cruzi]|nr:hypothetical protein TcBrA4_0023680 [Trypanosoma cruzi]